MSNTAALESGRGPMRGPRVFRVGSESKADLMPPGSDQSSEAGADRRSGLEKLLVVIVIVMGLLLVAAIAAIVAMALLAPFDGKNNGGVCLTAGCVAAANDIILNMDLTADPCEDFYQFACGGFEKRMTIPDDQTTLTQFSLLEGKLRLQLREILETEPVEGESEVLRLARDHYQSCMDLDAIEAQGLKPLQDILHELGGWPVVDGPNWNETSFNWTTLNYALRNKGYGSDYLFDFSIATDMINSSFRTIYIDQPTLGMQREYLVQGINETNMKHYHNYMTKVAVLLGADPKTAKAEMEEALLFEIKLANISASREARRDPMAMYFPMTIENVNNISDIVEWTEYVNTILTPEIAHIEPNEPIVVRNPPYLASLSELLRTEPKRNLANYMLWRAAHISLTFLNRAARDLSQEFSKQVTGVRDNTPRWMTCSGASAASFAASVGKLYVSKYFNNGSKETVLEMVSLIRDEFTKILDNVDWMDNETKKMAHTKLQSIKEYIGYPEEILKDSNLEKLYKGLNVTRDNYLGNGISMSIWNINFNWRQFRDKIDKTDWRLHAQPAVVNAFYNAIENSIQFPAGILQGMFFSKDRPTYLNFGGIGWVIGHEITHGFDDQGRNYDQEGNLRNWWQKSTMEEFMAKKACIIEQYSNYSLPALNISLNGFNSQGENIADNGGLKQTYRAYKRWVSANGPEQTLPGLDYSADQLFWLGAANSWCSKNRPQQLVQQVLVGTHSPEPFRVRGAFSNSHDFAKDWNCPARKPMNPVQKCQVW